MFSYLFGTNKSKSAASSSLSSRHSSTRSQDFAWSPHDGSSEDYDDVHLEAGARHTGTSGRQESSTSAGGSFANSARDSTLTSSYPPLPAFSRPSSNNGYPPILQTMTRLEALLAEQSPSLLDSLASPLSHSDPALSSLLHSIAPYSLPPAVLESYSLHDGQDTFAGSNNADGLFWGLWWMPIDQVEQEWRFWRRLEDAGGESGMLDAFSASTSDAKLRTRSHPYVGDQDDTLTESAPAAMNRMSSFPDGWVRKRYSHPGWLPLLTDRCGNYIGVDLDPPPPSASNSASTSRSRDYGQPGQVIAFGREIDQKVVLYPGDGAGGWGRFLATFVDDINKGEFASLNEGARRQQPNELSLDSSIEVDEWGLGDGIGERSYFEGDRYGEEGDDISAAESQRWSLGREYRRWMNPDAGGMVAVVAERSRRKWKSLGVGSRHHATSSIPAPKARVPLTVIVPETADTTGPESSITIKAASTSDAEASSARSSLSVSVPSRGSDSVEVVLSPPSPIVADDNHESSGNSSVVAGSSHRESARSPDLLDDGRRPFQPRPARQEKRKSRKPPPPPPASIDLPTMQDFGYGRSFYEDEASAVITTQPQFSRTSTSSNRSFRSATSVAPPPLLPTHSSTSVGQLQGASSSTTALVQESSSSPQSPSDSPVLSTGPRMEVVVEQSGSAGNAALP